MANGAERIDRDELLSRVDLVQLLTSLSGSPTRDGSGGRWRCPAIDHPDNHPSVTVTVDPGGTQRWKCWSGGHGGTAIDAAMVARRMPAGDAMRYLADHHAGVAPIKHEPPNRRSLDEPPDPAVLEYIHHAAKLLWTRAGTPHRQFLFDRGFDEPILRANLVGADPGRRYLPRPKGFPPGFPGVVYPALDINGEPIYFQTRYLEAEKRLSKYDNPHGRFAANPRMSWARPVEAPQPDRPLLICEGIPDGLTAAQAGFPSVGILGASIPNASIATRLATSIQDLPSLRSRAVVVVFDNDRAGRGGANHFAKLLHETGVPAHTEFPPIPGTDLGASSQADRSFLDGFSPEPPQTGPEEVAVATQSLGLHP